MRPLIVLPTYKEEENIAEIIPAILRSVPEGSVLVVDDGSPDQTAKIALRLADEDERVHVIQRRCKLGLGSAYLVGFEWGLQRGFDVLVEMDSDFSHDPLELPNLLAEVESGADLVIGSRYVPGGSIPDWTWFREQLSRWGNRYASMALSMPVRDSTSGFRAYRADALRELDLGTVRAEGYGFQIEMAYRVYRNGRKVVEVPIAFTDRVKGTSKMSGRIVWEALLLVTWWGVRDRLRRRPR
ncbi:MAG: polyprenol monophosphomannose synthase [Acidimicrobiales bacterium]|nr:MAG: polyprenol monophosphomannose synthase [Acidimicrobiales bacterium]